MKKHSSMIVIAGVLLGNMILAFGVATFVLPFDLIMGGATGIGIAFSKFLPFDISAIILVINIVLFLWGFVVLGKKFAITTLLSSIVYPVFLAAVRMIPGIETWTDNVLLASLFGGALLGGGIGIVMRMGSSTGGTDIVALIGNKWFHVPIAICMYIVDGVVILAQAFFSKPESILYGIVLLVVSTVVLNRVTLFGQAQIQLFIISEKYDEIREHLLSDIQVGATMVKIKTGLEQKDKEGVLCVIPNRKLYMTNQMVQSIDDAAFITISRINEVKGRGFSLDRQYKL